MMTRPPLGPTPRKIWLAGRVADLSRAINDYINHDDGNIQSIVKWSEELNNCSVQLALEMHNGKKA